MEIDVGTNTRGEIRRALAHLNWRLRAGCDRPGPGTDWQTWFCSVCGSRVPGENDSTKMFAPAGSLTQGGDALKVIHHIWVGSKAGSFNIY